MLFKNKTFKKGTSVPHLKNTAQCETIIMPTPEKVSIPMSHHIGAPCKPVVKKGDTVKIGQLIGDSDQFVSAPIYSSISGKVKKIDSIVTATGSNVQTVIIESDGKDEVYEEIKPPTVNNTSDFIKAIRKSGLVGLGGAGFPTHVKLKPPEGKVIEYLLINAAECEPYITSDFRESVENTKSIIEGINLIKEQLNIKNAIIGVEDNKPESIKILKEAAVNTDIKVEALKSRYPQGAEKMLIYAVTGRKVPAGGLPSDVGVVVMNVTSVSFAAKYMQTGMPLIRKRITVDGSAVKKPCNVEVAVGTSISDIIDFCGGLKSEPKKMIMGGPMMGIACYSMDMPVLKQNNAILVMAEDDAKTPKESPCIRCGRCVNTCPMNLLPLYLDMHSRSSNTEELQKYHIMDCMECGSCTYNCPAKRHLVQSIRTGKALVKRSAKGGK